MSVLRRCATGHRPRAAGRDRAAKKVPGAIGRSAPWSNRQIGSTPYWFDSCAARCSPRSATRPVELRPVSRRRPQHAVDPAQLPGSPAPKWAILSASVVEGPWPACPVDLGLGHASFKRLVVDPELLTDPNARASPCHWIFRAHRLSAGSSDPAAPPGTSAVPARSYLPWLAGLHQTRHRTTRPSPPTHRAGSSPSYPARHRAHARVQVSRAGFDGEHQATED